MSKPSIQNIDSLYSSCEGANSFNDLHRMHEEGPVITDPKKEVVEEILFLATALSLLCNTHRRVFDNLKITEVVASLASARNNSLRMLNNEDVTIGSWMLAMNVYHEDNQAMCDPQCTPTSIAVWDIPKCSGLCNPAIRLKELHEMSMCSKSPTLPSDDR